MSETIEFLQRNPWIYAILITVSIPIFGFVYYSALVLMNRQQAFWKAVLVGVVTFYATFGAGWLILSEMSKFDTEATVSSYHVLGGVIILLISWALGMIGALILLQGSFGTSVKVGAVDVALRLFVGLLLGAIGAVGVACQQIAKDPEQRAMLITVGVIFASVLGGFFGLFVLSNYLKNRANA